LIATAFKLPVSTSHGIVGATLGYALVLAGAEYVNWSKIAMIGERWKESKRFDNFFSAASWFVSPLLSGIVSACLYQFVKVCALQRKHHLTAAVRLLPFLYFAAVFVNVFSILFDGSSCTFMLCSR
jgi:phosphate/sulfate permease